MTVGLDDAVGVIAQPVQFGDGGWVEIEHRALPGSDDKVRRGGSTAPTRIDTLMPHTATVHGVRVTFEHYNAETEALIRFMIARLDEDDVMAGALPAPRLRRAVLLVGPLRETINDYRSAVHHYVETDGVLRRFWERAARIHGWYLRYGSRQYEDRAGYDPAWRRAPRSR